LGEFFLSQDKDKEGRIEDEGLTTASDHLPIKHSFKEKEDGGKGRRSSTVVG